MSTLWSTPYFRRKRVDALTNVAAFTTPSPLYLGITISVLAETANVLPSPSPECAGFPGYVRKAVLFDATMWSPADASGTTTNLLDVICFIANATWTTQGLGVFFADTATIGAGNILIAGSVTQPIFPVAGETVAFPATTLTLTLAAP